MGCYKLGAGGTWYIMNLNNDILKDMICTDYDSMGNHGRIPMTKKKKISKIQKFFEVIKNKLNKKNEKI